MNIKKYFTSEEATYAYQVTGKGAPVVLLHGFTGSEATWHPLVEQLKDHFQCITVDLPGHGETEINSPRTMEACCHDLAELFLHMGLSSVHLLGYSMGGRVALSFAMLYPQFLLSLTLESSSPGLKTFAEQKARQQQDEQLVQMIEEEGLEEFVNYWERIPLFTTQKNLPMDTRKAIRQERLSQSPIGLANSLRWMGTGIQPSWWNQLRRLTVPALLIVGAQDEKFVQINKEMKQYLPNALLAVISGAGHMVHVEKPVLFQEKIKRFIKTGQ